MPQSPAPVQSPQAHSYEHLTVHGELPGFCVGSVGPMVVSVWTRTAAPEHIDLIGQVQEQVLATHPKCVVASILRAELSMSVDEEVRQKSRGIIERLGDRTLRSVLVVERTGLRAAFFRSVITSVYFLLRTSTSQKISASLDEGLDWLFEAVETGEQGITQFDRTHTDQWRADVNRFAADVTTRHPPSA